MNKYVEICDLKPFPNLKRGGLNVLKKTVQAFFGCNAIIIDSPSRYAKKKLGIDISENIRRGCYIVDDNTVFLLGRIIYNNKTISALGIVIKKLELSLSTKIFNVFESSLTHKLSNSYVHHFRDSWHQLGDALIKLVISNYVSKGYYDYNKTIHLIDFMNGLRTTSFEGQFFSTGIILTRSNYAYNKKRGLNRAGDTYPLVKPLDLASPKPVDRRFWYLADGKTSYFLCDRRLRITQLFTLSEAYQNTGSYLDARLLPDTLKGGDVLFRVQNEKEFCVVAHSGLEFVYHENQWIFRDYNYIKHILAKNIKTDDNVVLSLIFYLLYCAHNSISSIIWIPEDLDKAKLLIKNWNKFIRGNITISDKQHTNHIIRVLSSDGATIIDKAGQVLFYGCVADTAKTRIKGVKGTGETAASILATNGISIKISQDGTIRIYLNARAKPIQV